jgi:hypothetical protein
MRNTALVIVVVAAAAAFLWWRARSPLIPESLFVVRFDDEAITVTSPNGETQSVMWRDLTKVGIRTTDDGPAQPDVFWGLHTGAEKAALVFPGGATGEQEVLAAMESRLPGFDDNQVIKAMGSTSNAYFLIWEQRKEPPDNPLPTIAQTSGAPAER